MATAIAARTATPRLIFMAIAGAPSTARPVTSHYDIMKNRPPIFALRPNFRFWQFVNNGWVRITLKPDQELTWSKSERHDEGWSSCCESWSLSPEATVVVYKSSGDGTDCDGRHSSHWAGRFFVRTGKYVPDFRYPEDKTPVTICRPDFIGLRSGQRDYTAEACGY